MDVTAEHALADVLGNAPKLVGGIVTLVQISERDAIYHRYATVAVPIERQRNSGIARILWGYMITKYTLRYLESLPGYRILVTVGGAISDIGSPASPEQLAPIQGWIW
jgi:hypothetical protein